MKKLLYLVVLLVSIDLLAEDNTTSSFGEEVKKDIKVIEASENIRYLSQKIAKDYLFFYRNPNKLDMKRKRDKSFLLLARNLELLEERATDEDTKDIIEFSTYSKERISEIFDEVFSSEKASLVMDYSDTLIEGIDSIISMYKYDFPKEKEMLIITKKMKYLLEKILKYYMASNIGFDKNIHKELMKDAIVEFDKHLEKINLYEYPPEEEKFQAKINTSWKKKRKFLLRSEEVFIPKLMLISANSLKNYIINISFYHSKKELKLKL